VALRELLLSLGVEVDEEGERRALTGLEKIKAAAKVAASAFAAIEGVQAITGIADEVRGLADEIDKTSTQLGISTDALQEYRHAAELSGVEAMTMSNALAELQKNAFAADLGSVGLQETFKKLGVNIKDSAGNIKDADTLMGEVAEGMKGLDNNAERVGISMAIMGGEGRKLLPMFAEGAAGLEAMRGEAAALGGVIDEELIASSVKLTDNQARLDKSLLGLKTVVAEELVPTLADAAERFTALAQAVRGPLSRGIRFLRRLFRGINTIVETVSDTFGWFGDLVMGLVAGLGLLSAAFLLVGKNATIAALKTAAAWIIANAPLLLMIGLIALIGLAIAIVIEDLQGMGEGAESFFGTLAQGFADLLESTGSWAEAIKEVVFNVLEFWFGTTRETFDGIFDYIDSLTDAMIEPFQRWGNSVVEIWNMVKDTAFGIIDDITTKFKFVFDTLSAGFDKISDFFGGETTAIQNLTQTTKPNIAGVSPASVIAPPGGATSNNSLINQPKTDIKVEVDATGRGDAADVASMVAREVDNAMANRDRQLLQAFDVAVGS
jgi:hypothetical protein